MKSQVGRASMPAGGEFYWWHIAAYGRNQTEKMT